MTNPYPDRSPSGAGNPFADGRNAETPGKPNPGDPSKENPYASPRQTAAPHVELHDQWSTPHRGGLILGLGISGVVLGVLGLMCCALLPVIGLGLSIPAWVMGRRDLQAIVAGTMDPTGQGPTRSGMILGIIGTVLGGLCVLFTVVMMAVYLVMFTHELSSP
jgi:hypothetical protein